MAHTVQGPPRTAETDDRGPATSGDRSARRRAERGPAPGGLLALVSAWSPALATAVLLAYGATAGAGVRDTVVATLVVVVSQVLPGVVVWRAVRPRQGWWIEDLALGFAIGSVLAIGAQIVAGLTQVGLLAWSTLLPAIVLLLLPVTRSRILSARTDRVPWWIPASVGALTLSFLGQLRGYVATVPVDWPSGARATHVDAYLHLALSAQLAERGPTTFPWVQSEALGYHWFSHAWVAQVGVASGSELDAVLFRVMPALMPVVVAAAVAAAALRLTGRHWAAPVAALIALWGGDLNVFGRVNAGVPIAPLSPSLALAAPMLVGAVVVLALRWRRQTAPGAVVVLVLLCVGAAGTKGSTLPLLVAGLALAAAAMLLFERRLLLRVAADLVLVIACLLVVLVLVFRGSGAGLHLGPADAANQNVYATWLGPVDGASHVAFVVLLVALGVASRGIAALLLPFSRTTRKDPTSWVLIGCACAGAGAASLFGHPGWSQHYFARSADPLIGLGSAVGLVLLVDWLSRRDLLRVVVAGAVGGVALVTAPMVLLGPLSTGAFAHAGAMLVVGIAVVVVTAVCAAAGGRGVRALRLAAGAAVLAVLVGGLTMNRASLVTPPPATLADVPMKNPLAVSVDQIEAARWIRDHSDPDDLVMTNRHCVTPQEPYDGCDSRRWNVAAFSERQVLVEGWTAVPRSAEIAPEGRDSITVAFWDQPLLRLNDGFVADPTQQAADELRDRGVRWVFADRTRPRAETLEPYAELRFSNDDVDVYELPPAS